jgi:hypothetical protein
MTAAASISGESGINAFPLVAGKAGESQKAKSGLIAVQ